MYAIINDMIDLVRLRVQPLAHYQYANWKSSLIVVCLGIIASAGVDGLGDNVPGRIVFFVLFTWLQLGLVARFMTVWLRLFKCSVKLPLFGLLVACHGIDILSSLTSWLPKDMGAGVNLVLALTGLLVMINSIAVVSGLSRAKVFLGTVAVSPLLLVLLLALLRSLSLKSAPLGVQFNTVWKKLSASALLTLRLDSCFI